MEHLVAREIWGTVDFDTIGGRVFVQENWHYLWKSWPGVTAGWTQEEKRATHAMIDREIWGVWSHRVRLRIVGGTSIFARRFPHGREIPVNFDIRWVLNCPAHWEVTVWKMPAGAGPTALHRSFVNHQKHKIELNTADLRPRVAVNQAKGRKNDFMAGPHEYGHTIGSPKKGLGDEYLANQKHIADTDSLKNVGRQVRRRHLTEISLFRRICGKRPGNNKVSRSSIGRCEMPSGVGFPSTMRRMATGLWAGQEDVSKVFV